MNIYDPIAIALGLPQTIDISEYPDYDSIPKTDITIRPIKWSDDMRKECGDRQRQLLSTGDHYFSKNTERNIAKVTNGTHPFLDREAQSRRGAKGGRKSSSSASNLKRMSEGKHVQVSTVTCPHCGKSGNYMIMKRWHFDNCKSYTSSSE